MKMTDQVLGTNTIGKVPCQIAAYLGYPNSKDYTGHCFRRTGATLLANVGKTLVQLKQAGG